MNKIQKSLKGMVEYQMEYCMERMEDNPESYVIPNKEKQQKIMDEVLSEEADLMFEVLMLIQEKIMEKVDPLLKLRK